MERTLVLIKPDAVVKGISGLILFELEQANLKMIGLKIVNVKKDLAEKHYEKLREKPFFENLINHLIGSFHNNSNVIAIVYEGENAIQKIRNLTGKTFPDDAEFCSIRGRYGRHNQKTDCVENVIHTSDSPESAKKEISLWFDDSELIK
ncbi:nucleoside-diphosphate kinase [Candidatus Pacearchaeota archaeon CG10_big_fil_rev_8_21_14_0_10_32_42]|nr:MAG: nucleoside-diphosphate kinase [Candidatus Pacearchaeota archaeon CG10_big_fil_rev_8_21_14_0_10_32_42]